ncbi:acetyl-CoA acetyltransferase [Roseovarius halotolerans]|uniref:Thiolase n=1 Tax=Roseovarius halotolerans TaxID=505353 RepID=A0A1X6Y7S8_9RHOB|nr:acetyl-CoA acetyltransferase [Roseovarius halotolerans]RKT35164.1 acetyl-CoA acetyltransferase [Roseovarius halotolerans]SLN12762.1 thiolase [Roseovarius halotolerans]
MSNTLKGAAAIVGVGTAGLGEAPGFNAMDIQALAVRAALEDAGLSLADVDGLFCANMSHTFPAISTIEYLGIAPRWIDGTNTGGSSFVAHAMSAAMALQAGLCDVALICYGATMRTGAGRMVPAAEQPTYEIPHQPRYPMTAYAMAAARHMAQFGTTREHLAEVALAARAWAQLNPDAFERGDLTMEDVLSSRMVLEPLTLRDCCLLTDGAGAVVMTRPDRARDLAQKPAYFLGGGVASYNRAISEMPDLTTTAAKDSGARAYAMAGLGPADMNVLQLYDAFTINVILFLEDLGFCPKGEGGAFVSGGHIAPGGGLPVNTNGGGLSFTHPGMYGIFTLIEATRQLRGEAGARQIPDAETVLCHGNGITLSHQATAILGSENTL